MGSQQKSASDNTGMSQPQSLSATADVKRLSRELRMAKAALQKVKEDLHWELAVGSALRELHGPLISPDLSIEEMAKLVLAKARELTGSTRGFVSTLDSRTGQLAQSASEAEAGTGGLPGKSRRMEDSGEVDNTCFCSRPHSGEPQCFKNRTKPVLCTCFGGAPLAVERFICVPVMLDGKPAGKIALANSPRDYSNRDVQAVRHLASLYALAMDRKKYQIGIIDTLREKELLLREIHHRVKNNLQVISSLLNLQAGCLKDPKALEMLKESQNRVRSMAIVHEHLHRSRDLSKISFGEYVRTLCASLFSSYGIDSSRIALRIRVDETSFAIDTAISCGLIIQELVSNSLKHAFPSGRPGEINIRLQTAPGRRLMLLVGDNGVGIPDTVDVLNAKSLGLRLVRILAAQIDGSVSCSSGKGTSFKVTFRESEENSWKQ